MWAKFTDNNMQEDLLGVGVNADPGLLEAVLKDPLGIGYNNLGYAYDMTTGLPVSGILTAPIDINANGTADPDEVADTMTRAMELIATGKYPSPSGASAERGDKWQTHRSRAGFHPLDPDRRSTIRR